MQIKKKILEASLKLSQLNSECRKNENADIFKHTANVSVLVSMSTDQEEEIALQKEKLNMVLPCHSSLENNDMLQVSSQMLGTAFSTEGHHRLKWSPGISCYATGRTKSSHFLWNWIIWIWIGTKCMVSGDCHGFPPAVWHLWMRVP